MKHFLLAIALSLPPAAAMAQQLDVDFDYIEDDPNGAAGCGGSVVTGLDPNGDGFLAVRSGPGTQFRKIAELYNGDMVATCAAKGPWIGVFYGPRGNLRKGWVHGRWLESSAG